MWDGVAVFFTALGSIATAVAAGVSVFLVRRDLLDRERRTLLEERAQAEKVQISRVEPNGGHGHVRGRMFVPFKCNVLNGSSDPISDALVTFIISPVGWEETGFPRRLELSLGRVDAGASHPCFSQEVEFPWSDETGGAAQHIAISTLAFKDAAGRHWFRDGRGTLHRAQGGF